MPKFKIKLVQYGESYETWIVDADDEESATDNFTEEGEKIGSWFKSRDSDIVSVEEIP